MFPTHMYVSKGKSFPEALILASTTGTSIHNMTTVFYGNSMNNLLSYCGLIDAKIRASDKGLPLLPSKLRSLIQFVEILYEGAFFHSYFCKISMEHSYIDCRKSEKIMYT